MWSKVNFFITIKCPSTIKLFSKENDITNWYETWSFVIQEVVIFCHFMSCPTILSGNTSVVHLLIWMLCRHRWQYNLDYKQKQKMWKTHEAQLCKICYGHRR